MIPYGTKLKDCTKEQLEEAAKIDKGTMDLYAMYFEDRDEDEQDDDFYFETPYWKGNRWSTVGWD